MKRPNESVVTGVILLTVASMIAIPAYMANKKENEEKQRRPIVVRKTIPGENPNPAEWDRYFFQGLDLYISVTAAHPIFSVWDEIKIDRSLELFDSALYYADTPEHITKTLDWIIKTVKESLKRSDEFKAHKSPR